jgi:hypothetical protein
MEFSPESFPPSLSLFEPRARSRFDQQVVSLPMIQAAAIPVTFRFNAWA